MKRIMLVCAGLSVALLGSACGGDETGAQLASDGTMSAIISDTLPWSANMSLKATLVGGVLVVEGLERTGRFVRLNVRGVVVNAADPDTDRTFQFSYLNSTTGFAVYSESIEDTFDTTAPGGTGNVTITRLTASRVEGTFAFVATRLTGATAGLHLAGGRFDVRIQ